MALTERKSLPHFLFVMLRWQINKKMGNDFFRVSVAHARDGHGHRRTR